MCVSVRAIFFAVLAIINIFAVIGSSSDGHSEKVVIIGGGAAGIAAAAKLLANGYENVIILEAEDRIGGRVWTVNDGDKLLELGAQW